jgi:hypothetical protein
MDCTRPNNSSWKSSKLHRAFQKAAVGGAEQLSRCEHPYQVSASRQAIAAYLEHAGLSMRTCLYIYIYTYFAYCNIHIAQYYSARMKPHHLAVESGKFPGHHTKVNGGHYLGWCPGSVWRPGPSEHAHVYRHQGLKCELRCWSK